MYEFGGAVLPVWAAWNPMSTDAPGAMVALCETFLAVTLSPSIVAGPVLVRVMFEVRPVFQALTVAVTRQAAVPGDGVEVWNCVKNFHTSPGSQVLELLSPAALSCGAAMCPSSNAAQATGCPAEQPE